MIGTYRSVAAAASLLAVLCAGQAQAEQLTLDLTGISSYGEMDDPANTVLEFNLGAGAEITAVSWDVTVTATAPSWLSELALDFYSTSRSSWITFTPSFTDAPGTENQSGSVSLADVGLTFFADDDGKVYFQFNELFDDSSVSPDGSWGGSITFDYVPGVPEPSTYALMALGIAGVGFMARRRKAS